MLGSVLVGCAGKNLPRVPRPDSEEEAGTLFGKEGDLHQRAFHSQLAKMLLHYINTVSGAAISQSLGGAFQPIVYEATEIR